MREETTPIERTDLRRHAITLFSLYLLCLVVTVTAKAGRWPVPPSWWRAQARCITYAESRNDPAAVGNGSYGLFQFELGTWASVGGQGNPVRASVAEQTYRAWMVWRRDGGSWVEWSTAYGCRLR